MRIKNNVLYPFPVLSKITEDYVGCDFNINLSVIKKSKKKIILDIEPFISCKTLASLLNERKSKVVVHIECPQTKFRNAYDLSLKMKSTIVIEARKLSGLVQVVGFVVATQDILELKNVYNEFNPDYGNSSFNVDNGSILAISSQLDFQASKDIYDLSNVSSIISVIPYKDSLGEMKIELTDEKIRVMLPTDTYSKYSIIGNTENNYTPILHSMFALPALVYALEHLHQQSEWLDDEDSLWFKVIKKRIEENYPEFDIKLIENKTSIVLAQELIGNPISDATLNLMEMGDRV